MSLDPMKLCELCGENVNGYGHRPECATNGPQVGWTREDEQGWFIVDRRELDDDVDGFWVSDRWGGEHFIPTSRMGDNWKAPQ